MKMAFVTIQDSSDIKTWSGTPYFMHQAFQKHGFDVILIGNLRGPRSVLLRIRSLFRTKILRERYSTFRHETLLSYYARQVDAEVAILRPDVIVCPSTLPIAYLKTDIPVVIWTDATFASLLEFYPEYRAISRQAMVEGNATEQRALSLCSLAFYASQWAADSARNDYRVDPKKIHVIPMGANLPDRDSSLDIPSIVKNRSTDRCDLALLGVDWERKGAAIAIDVAIELNRKGLPTRLTVAGCSPPTGFNVPECVNLVGFLNKSDPKGLREIEDILKRSHFLIIPSRAECYGIVFAEANSFGTPGLASDVGGISTAIRSGINGYVVPTGTHSEEVERYCVIIQKALENREKYYELAMSSFLEYRDRLNWSVAASTGAQLIRAMLEKKVTRYKS